MQIHGGAGSRLIYRAVDLIACGIHLPMRALLLIFRTGSRWISARKGHSRTTELYPQAGCQDVSRCCLQTPSADAPTSARANHP